MLKFKKWTAIHKKILILCFSIFIVILGINIGIYALIIKPNKEQYAEAVKLMENHEYEKSKILFDKLKNYNDSQEKSQENASYLSIDQLIEEENYEAAIKLLNSIKYSSQVAEKFETIYQIAINLNESGAYNEALAIFIRLKDYQDSRHFAIELIKTVNERNQTSLVSGYSHAVSLSSDGKLTTLGSNVYGQCNLSSWRNIKKVYADGNYTMGIKKDGSVVIAGAATEDGKKAAYWTGIKEIALLPSPQLNKAIGLKEDGTVVATYQDTKVWTWTGIDHIAASDTHVVGLKKDGSVEAVGKNDKGQCDVSNWSQITQVIAGNGYTLGLSENGTVLLAGDNSSRESVINWSDISYLWSSDILTIGLKNDGTLIGSGTGAVSLDSWKNISQLVLCSQGAIGLQINSSLVSIGLTGLPDWNEVYNIHMGDYQFCATRKDGTLLAKTLITPPLDEELNPRIDPSLGMTPDEIKASSWGTPDKIISITDVEGAKQDWIYGTNTISFLNGVVVSIQEEETFSTQAS